MSTMTHGSAPNPWRYSIKVSLALVLTSVLIASGFYVIHSLRINDSLASTKLIAQAIFDHEDSLSEDSFGHLERKAQSLLKFRHVHSVALMSPKDEVLFVEGIALTPKTISQVRKGSSEIKQGQFLTFVSLLDGAENESFRLLVEVDMRSESLIDLQFLFLCTIVLIGIFAVTIYLNRELSEGIFDPLEELNDELSKNNNIGLMVPIKLTKAGIYSELIQQTNESFAIQTDKSEEFRKNIEVATQELRESLETVEIQNIDLDIARKNAVELNKLKSEFLKKTSQDLLTPLRGILSFIELTQNSSLNADQKEYLSTIEDSARGMLAIVNDISDFSRLETGKLQLDQKPLNLRNTIESTLTLQSPAALNCGVTLYSTFDPKLPSAVLGDPLRVQQVVSNLISNAIKFEHSGFVFVRTELVKSLDEEIDIAIRIQTDGLCPSEFELWQDPDFEIKNINKAFYSRAGMGLIVAKGLSQHMKGNVSFEVEKDMSTFTLELRCANAKLPTNEQRTIDPSYKVNAVVFSNNEIGYRELASRLSELSIRTHRANDFSEILSIAHRLNDNRHKHARYLPLAVIEAQTSHQTLDKIVLTQTLKTVTEELNIPTLVIAPSGKHENLQKTLSGVDVDILQHPIMTPRFHNCAQELLGVIQFKSDQASGTPTPSPNLRPIKVLVVDDNLANIKLSKALLSDFNVETSTACSGGEALSIAKTHSFDLIFMDIELPDINGFETTKLIRKSEFQNKRVPIVALTAHDVSEEKTKLLLAGMDDVVGKPLTTKDISTILDRWVIGTQQHKSSNPNSESPSPSVTNPEPIETVSEASPVNISECLSLAKNNASLAKDMLSMLLASLPEERIKINLSAIDSDLSSMYEVIHKLHGACCYCGVPRLRNITKTLDAQLKNNNETQLIEHLEEFYGAVDELLQWHEAHDIDALFD